MLRPVSLRVSPFVRLDVAVEMLMTSALKRNAASSNEMRVRVLGSTKKLTIVLPRSAGTFLISRVPTCLNASAVSRMKLISSAERSRRPSKSFRVQRPVIVSPKKQRPVRRQFAGGGVGLFRRAESADFCRRNRGESATHGGRDRLMPRAESELAGRTN